MEWALALAQAISLVGITSGWRSPFILKALNTQPKERREIQIEFPHMY